jgi:hypothetical protein
MPVDDAILSALAENFVPPDPPSSRGIILVAPLVPSTVSINPSARTAKARKSRSKKADKKNAGVVPHAPKDMNSHMFFKFQVTERFKTANPHLRFDGKDLANVMGKVWRRITPATKELWAQAAKDYAAEKNGSLASKAAATKSRSAAGPSGLQLATIATFSVSMSPYVRPPLSSLFASLRRPRHQCNLPLPCPLRPQMS